MNYERIYKEFIADRRSKEAGLTGYTEKHHILPRSLKGSDEPENLIRLTPGDHYFAHLLLAKIHGGNQWAAVALMSNMKSTSARGYTASRTIYAIAKEKMAQRMRENNPSNPAAVSAANAQRLIDNPNYYYEQAAKRAYASGKAHHMSKGVINLTTGETFPSGTAGEKHYGMARGSIRNCCTGKAKTAKGMRFAFA